MEIKNTEFSKVILETELRYINQNGSIPSGSTASTSKYPVNTGFVSAGSSLNTEDGPTLYPYYPIYYIDQSNTLKIQGDWSNKVKPGDVFTISRGQIRQDYTVLRNVTVYDLSFPIDISTITVDSSRKTALSFDPFLETTGYPYPSTDSFVQLNRRVENPNSFVSNVIDFSTIMLKDTDINYKVKVAWEIAPEVSATRLRWRSVPRNTTISNLSFTVGVTGVYASIPFANIISTTGRGAKIELKGSLYSIETTNVGSGYTYANAYITNGGGGTATLSVTLNGDEIDTVTIDSTDSEFSIIPNVVITGDGTGGQALVNKIIINGLNVIQTGGGYMSTPIVTVDDTYLISGGVEIQATLVLINAGRVDYFRVIDGGAGYTGASVSVSGSGSSDEATGTPIIKDGIITDIIVNYNGNDYVSASVAISPYGTGGTGASAIANVDIYSEWVYESPMYEEKEITLTGFKYNIPYEIQILASIDQKFIGENKYSTSIPFQYLKV
jgi:hypothetical protein